MPVVHLVASLRTETKFEKASTYSRNRVEVVLTAQKYLAPWGEELEGGRSECEPQSAVSSSVTSGKLANSE